MLQCCAMLYPFACIMQPCMLMFLHCIITQYQYFCYPKPCRVSSNTSFPQELWVFEHMSKTNVWHRLQAPGPAFETTNCEQLLNGVTIDLLCMVSEQKT